MAEQELGIGLETEGDMAVAELDAAQPVRTRRLFSNAVAFIAMAALQRAISFLLLPFVTRALGPSQYGQLSIALSGMQLASVLFGLGFDYAVFRLYLARDANAVRREQVVFSTWVTVMASGAIGGAVLTLLAWLLVTPAWSVTWSQASLAAIAAALTAATLVPFSVLRADGRVRAFVAINLTIALSSTVLVLLWVVVLHWGPVGFLGATATASALGMLVAIWVVPLPGIHRFHRGIVRAALRFGTPLLPHFASHWALQLADRVVLATLVTDAKVGIYSLAGNFGLVALVGVQGINLAVMPTYARAAHDPAERERLANLAVLQAIAVSVICVTIALFGPVAVNLVLPADFSSATNLIPWITLGYAFLGFYFIPMNEVSLSAGRTELIWVGTATAAAVDIAAILIFVPTYGIMAAAVASPVAYSVLLGWLLFYRRRHSIVQHNVGGLLRAVVAIGLVYVAAIGTTGATTVLDLFFRAAWMMAIPLLLFGLGVINRDDIRRIFGAVEGSLPAAGN